MILHHLPCSRSMRRLRLIKERCLKDTLREGALTEGRLRRAEFRALSRAGRIPALQIEGRALFSSGAILSYARQAAGPAGSPPGDPRAPIAWRGRLSPKPRRRSRKM